MIKRGVQKWKGNFRLIFCMVRCSVRAYVCSYFVTHPDKTTNEGQFRHMCIVICFIYRSVYYVQWLGKVLEPFRTHGNESHYRTLWLYSYCEKQSNISSPFSFHRYSESHYLWEGAILIIHQLCKNSVSIYFFYNFTRLLFKYFHTDKEILLKYWISWVIRMKLLIFISYDSI